MDGIRYVVLHSGGLDSTVLLHKVLCDTRSRGDWIHSDEILALNIRYGQKHSKELEFAKWTCETMGVRHMEVDLSQVFSINPEVSSLLKESGKEIEHSSYAEQTKAANGKPVETYVPYRNGLFLSYAAAVAYQVGASEVFYGAHRDDAAGEAYPDCSKEFVQAQADAIYRGTGSRVALTAPFINMTKAEIVKEGIRQNMASRDWAHTWSCYEAGEVPCGVCGTCRDRAAAFAANNMKDPLEWYFVREE